MNKPVIVLSPQAMPMEAPFREKYHFTNRFNTSAIGKAGGIPVLPPYVEEADAEDLLSRADGLFLTGGGDISPALYGEEPKTEFDELDPDRDRTDYALLTAALKLHKPVLCICRGYQIANVYFGGSLYQDIATQYQTELKHPDYPGYAQETAHTVELVPGTPMAQLLGESVIGVNTLHHQAIRQLAHNLRPMAYAPDGILEAWYLPDDSQWMWGMQWHPEMLENSPRADKIFRAFLEACKK